MNKLQRNIIKFKINKSNKLNNKRGAELVESILMVGVAISTTDVCSSSKPRA
jgi:hypothetical protein